MASRPHQPQTLEDKRSISKGFDLGAITDPIANFFSQYSTVQVKNGSQNLLLVRGDSGDVATPLQTGAGGAVAIASTSKALSDAKAKAAFKKTQGFWAGLPSGAKIGIIAGGAGVLVIGVVFIAFRR